MASFFLSNKSFSQKNVFQTKKFYFDYIGNTFNAFYLPLVKKNHQNRERRKRSGYRKKPSSNWLEKDQWESIICVQPLTWEQILFVGKRQG